LSPDELSEVESSVNDNSEKYQILEEETDGDDPKVSQEDLNPCEEDPPTLQRQNSRSSNGSIEEALRALDIAIGSEDDGESDVESAVNIDEIREEATFLVESIVNDCEKILEEKQRLEDTKDTPKKAETFEEFEDIACDNMSTPCTVRSKTIATESTDLARALFPGGIDLSDIVEETFAVDKTYEVNEKTFEVCGVNNNTFEVNDPVKPADAPSIKIDKEENGSEDLTTVTPVNTPIELSFSSETWDKITCNKPEAVELDTGITFNQDGWYLHPKAKSENDTFDICDDEEANEGNMEDMSSTYDQLRRQLTEMLPHAQGMSTHNDFLDDDDLKDSSSPSENYGIKYGDLDEATNAAVINPEPANEMHINYKRPLSPIMEESECDETCRTFVCNETKLLDSTSTGMMESASAEAQMGQMPKALMASNDTLFNFEDTLSDQTDNLLMSPRIHTAGSSGSSTLSRQEPDRISLERTPTNEEPPKIDAIVRNSLKQHPLNLDLAAVPSTSKYEVTVSKMSLEDGSWPLELPEAQQIINDLSSPEQNRTADSLSFEQDVTYTIDDQKTCVSFVLKNDDERISEISEPLFASESIDLLADDDDDKAESLQIDDVLSLDADDNFNYELNDVNGNQDFETKEMEMTLNVQEASAVFDNDSINPDGDEASKREFEADSLEPEAKILGGELKSCEKH
jgi:hypothetical protein